MRVNALQRHMQAMMAPNSAEERALTNIVCGLDAYVQVLRAQKKHWRSARDAALPQDLQRTFANAFSDAAGLTA